MATKDLGRVVGKSAYEVWLEAGHTGTMSDFLNSLKGVPGDDGQQGPDGKSAYDIWTEHGGVGTEQDFLNSLKGEDGRPGADGQPGEKGRGISNITYQRKVEHIQGTPFSIQATKEVTQFEVGDICNRVFFDTTKSIEEVESVLSELDWDNAEEIDGGKALLIIGGHDAAIELGNAVWALKANGPDIGLEQDAYMITSNLESQPIWINVSLGDFSSGWSTNNHVFDTTITLNNVMNLPFMSATPMMGGKYATPIVSAHGAPSIFLNTSLTLDKNDFINDRSILGMFSDPQEADGAIYYSENEGISGNGVLLFGSITLYDFGTNQWQTVTDIFENGELELKEASGFDFYAGYIDERWNGVLFSPESFTGSDDQPKFSLSRSYDSIFIDTSKKPDSDDFSDGDVLIGMGEGEDGSIYCYLADSGKYLRVGEHNIYSFNSEEWFDVEDVFVNGEFKAYEVFEPFYATNIKNKYNGNLISSTPFLNVIPFEATRTYDKIYFDTSKSIDEVVSIILNYAETARTGNLILGTIEDLQYSDFALYLDAFTDESTGKMSYFLDLGGDGIGSNIIWTSDVIPEVSDVAGWQNLDEDGVFEFQAHATFNEVHNISLMSSAPIDHTVFYDAIYFDTTKTLNEEDFTQDMPESGIKIVAEIQADVGGEIESVGIAYFSNTRTLAVESVEIYDFATNTWKGDFFPLYLNGVILIDPTGNISFSVKSMMDKLNGDVMSSTPFKGQAGTFKLGDSCSKIYFDTSKSDAYMEEMLSNLVEGMGAYTIIYGYSEEDGADAYVEIFTDDNPNDPDKPYYAIITEGSSFVLPLWANAIIEGEEIFSGMKVGWQNLDSDGAFTFPGSHYELVEELLNTSFASPTPFNVIEKENSEVTVEYDDESDPSNFIIPGGKNIHSVGVSRPINLVRKPFTQGDVCDTVYFDTLDDGEMKTILSALPYSDYAESLNYLYPLILSDDLQGIVCVSSQSQDTGIPDGEYAVVAMMGDDIIPLYSTTSIEEFTDSGWNWDALIDPLGNEIFCKFECDPIHAYIVNDIKFISSIQVPSVSETNLTINYTDGSDPTVVPIPDGKPGARGASGRGVSYIYCSGQSASTINFMVEYTDGSSEEITLDTSSITPLLNDYSTTLSIRVGGSLDTSNMAKLHRILNNAQGRVELALQDSANGNINLTYCMFGSGEGKSWRYSGASFNPNSMGYPVKPVFVSMQTNESHSILTGAKVTLEVDNLGNISPQYYSLSNGSVDVVIDVHYKNYSEIN